MKIKIYCIVSLFLLLGCNKNNSSILYRVIDEHYKKNHSKNINIDLIKAIPFKWDSLYIFNATASLTEINSVIGLYFDNYEEFSDIIIFIHNHKIFRYEKIPLKFKGIDPAGGGLKIIFPKKTGGNYFLIDKNSCIFNIKTSKNYREEKYYELSYPNNK